MIKKQLATLAIAMALATGLAFAAVQKDNVMRRQADGTYVVNTASLAPNVRGFRGATPLEVYIKNGKVVKVEALANHETPKFFAKVKTALLPKFSGMKVSKAAGAAGVDGVTGATLSSKAVKANVAAAVAYYRAHR
ncbi:FMN-binding protein [Prevotella dentasini]|uniref:FMN-binding protein n=1 Tax=Prevotella dentasini TaxID=589537 RepID=UPI000468834F|nr:FMN-binding protein [Prevotella dentasini]